MQTTYHPHDHGPIHQLARSQPYGHTCFSLGCVSFALAALAITVCFIPRIALTALPMSLLALAAGLLDVKSTFEHRDARLGVALLACLLSLAAFVMSVNAASSVRRLSDRPSLDSPQRWVQPGSSMEMP